MGEQDQTLTLASRPKWRRIVDFPLVAMLIAIALFILAVAAGNLIGPLLSSAKTLPALALRAAVDVALALIVYKLVIARLGEQPRNDLRVAGAGKSLAAGLVIGFLLFCALVGIAALLGVYRVVGPGSTAELPRDLIAIGIVPAFLEELLFRGILFRWIEDFAGSLIALALTAMLFGAAHLFNPGATWSSSLALMVEAGVMLGGAYMLARNLWLPMGMHAAWNFTQGFIFGAPVSGIETHGLVQAKLMGPALLSGGAFGLEASMIGVVLSVPLGAGLVMFAVRRGELIRPWWVRGRAPSVN